MRSCGITVSVLESVKHMYFEQTLCREIHNWMVTKEGVTKESGHERFMKENFCHERFTKDTYMSRKKSKCHERNDRISLRIPIRSRKKPKCHERNPIVTKENSSHERFTKEMDVTKDSRKVSFVTIQL